MDYPEYSSDNTEDKESDPNTDFSWKQIQELLESSIEDEAERIQKQIQSKKNRIEKRRKDRDRNIGEIEEEVNQLEDFLEKTYKPSGDEEKEMPLKRLIGELLQERRYERRQYWKDVFPVFQEIEDLKRELQELQDSTFKNSEKPNFINTD